MTVSYSLDVSKSSIAGFFRLQFRWRGSIWKSVMRELILFCFLFGCVAFLYRSGFFSDDIIKHWDAVVELFDSKMDYVPLTFMLGFFVTIIVNRWNEIFNNIGWIDPTALVMSTFLRGADEKSRILRRNVIRYMVLTQVLVFRDISMQVRKRFPTIETIVAAGLMTEDERLLLQECPVKFTKYYMPIQWAFAILYEARVAGKIGADLMLNEIMKNILDFRRGLAQLSNFDWVPIPLVYPQVVFLAVRSYFFIALFARQSVLIDGQKPKNLHPIYPFVPFIMTALQFIFYVGWMKVAESLMNPLGEDDDDFECNFLIDRNLQMGLAIVDDTYNSVPPQLRDPFWSEKAPEPLYSADTATKPMYPQVGSAAQYEVKADEVVMMPHESTEMEVDVDGGDRERLLPRGISIVSVNRGGDSTNGSRMSLNTQKGRGSTIIGSLRKQFSRSQLNLPSTRVAFGEGRVSRPARLGMGTSQSSLNTPSAVELATDFDVLDELAADSAKNPALMTPDPEGIPIPAPPIPSVASSPQRRFSPDPHPEGLSSVPEEDEETQRTRNANDLRAWLRESQGKGKEE